MSSTEYYDFYRATSVAEALLEILDELFHENRISGAMAMKVLDNFDRAIAQTLAQEVKATTKIKGHIKTYNVVEGVYSWVLTDVTFETKENQRTGEALLSLNAPLLKVVACETKKDRA